MCDRAQLPSGGFGNFKNPKKNLRLLEQPALLSSPYAMDIRRISGGYLPPRPGSTSGDDLKVVTKRPPTEAERNALDFAWRWPST